MHLGIIKITYNRTVTHFMDNRFVNLGEEVILTLLSQSGTSESATVCFVISLSICYWQFKCWVLHVLCVCVCVCVCVRACACVCERERDRVTSQHINYLNRGLCVWVCVCVCVRERERERERESDRVTSQRSVQCVRNRLNRGLFANTYKHHHCVRHATLFPSRAWTDGKTKDIINCLYFYFESWSSRLWKGALHFRSGLWCSANHNALCQLANQSRLCLSEGGTL